MNARFPILWSFSVLASVTATAQNLVPNPSFESYSECPNFASQLDRAAPWFNPTSGTPEFFHGCAPYGSWVSVPDQPTGNYQPARTGIGYGGIYIFRTDIPGMREYMEIPLLEPLRQGECYQVEFFVNQPNDHPLVSDAVGACLIQGELRLGTTKEIPLLPQVSNPAGQLITDTAGWTCISGYFTALGGEDHLIIGNFRNDANTAWQVFNPGAWYPNSAYLLVDDVSVTRVNLSLPLGPDTAVCEGQQVLLDASATGTAWQWSDGSTAPQLVVTEGGTFWVKAMLGGCSVTDTLRIDVEGIPVARLPGDTTLCTGEVLRLDVSAWGARYRWSDQSTESVFIVSRPGTYAVVVYNDCGCDSAAVTVGFNDCFCTVTVPNVFTPNGDGYNDRFRPRVDCRIRDYELRLFNRWGKLVFSSHDPDGGWDGKVGNQAAAPGVYFWSLDYSGNDNGTIIRANKTGTLSLIY